MRILITGDTHGNADWLRAYIYPVALATAADAIVVLGDYGAWEHTAAGRVFMDEVGDLSLDSAVPLYWLHGNHDKHSDTLQRYGHRRRVSGFVPCRDQVFYIPQGLSWSWDGVAFRSFGGAYSVDKTWRLERERWQYERNLRRERYRSQAAHQQMQAVAQTEGTLWFPEEEMTDADMNALLKVDSSPKQIVLSHDKPYSAQPPWNRKDLPGCLPNQMRLERALRAHQPAYWVHGHLHYHYTQTISAPDFTTTVIGLDPDGSAAEDNWRENQTWLLADCDKTKLTITLGTDLALDAEQLQQAISQLA